MGRQQVQNNPGILTPKGHPANQYKQGSWDQHRLHPKRSHRQEEHKLCLHHHPGDQLQLEKLRLHLHKTTYRARESRVNQNTITLVRTHWANNTGSSTSKGKKNRKKSTHEVPPQPGMSAGGVAVPRMDFISRNLGTGRPTIQCTACREYSHWRRECLYDNFCTTCNNHNHATHMCWAPKDTPQQNPTVCVYCGSMEHSSIQCCSRCIPPETRNLMYQQQNFRKSRLPVNKQPKRSQPATCPQVV